MRKSAISHIVKKT